MDGGRSLGIDSGAARQGLSDVQANHFVCPSQQLAYRAVEICNAPARIVDNHPVGNSLHHVFALAHLPSRVLGKPIDLQKEARILYRQPDLLRKLLQ